MYAVPMLPWIEERRKQTTEDPNTPSLMMQKRPRAANSTSLSLDSGEATLLLDTSSKYRNENDASGLCGPIFWSVMTLAVMSLLVVFCIRQFTENNNSRTAAAPRALALAQFPTLSWALDHADLVGVYFAAQWCPMSTPVTAKLGQHFPAADLLPPPDVDSTPSKQHAFALVYVSSDATQEALDEYAKPNWIKIPMEQNERTALKKHFSACAKRELAELDMERKFEIPTLLILDGATHGVITTNGADDVMHRGAKALEYWQELLSKLRAMEQRFRA
jgi:hypothetical protein